MGFRPFLLLAVGVALGVLPKCLPAQSRGFAILMVGTATDADDSESGSDLAFSIRGGFQTGLFGFGAEVGEQRTGNDNKSDLLGGFFRVVAPVGRFRPFAIAGVGVYRFASAGIFDNTRAGLSIGTGFLADLGLRRARFALEARYHSMLNRKPGISAQRFVTVLGGIQFGL